MVDAWVNCPNCGNRFGTFLDTCPKCGFRVASQKKNTGRYVIIGVGAMIAIIIPIIMMVYSSQPEVISSNVSEIRSTNDISGNESVSGISYEIFYISVQSMSDAEFMRVAINVENESNEPQPELQKDDFSLSDSKGRLYTPQYYSGVSLRDIQPGLGGQRALDFLLQFDKDLDYYLKVGDKTIHLGKGSDFDIDVELATKIAFQSEDVTDCNMLRDNTECVAKYAQKFNQSDVCQSATKILDCFNMASLGLGPENCKFLNDKEIIQCAENYFKIIGHRTPEYRNSPAYKDCVGEVSFLVKDNGCLLQILDIDSLSKSDLLGWQVDGKPVVCLTIPGIHPSEEIGKQYCIAAIGTYLKDLSVCDQAGVARAECYGAIAHTEDFVTLETCNVLETDSSFCYMHVAYRLNDMNICEKLDENKQNCINLVNRKNSI